MPLPVSLCMIVRDEAELLPRCLEVVRGLVDEIIVLDTGSSDASVSIARAAGARVKPFVWREDFAAARNASLAMASKEWVLVLDADEILEPDSTALLPDLLEQEDISALEVTIENLNDRGPAQSFSVIRLFRNHPEIRFSGAIHEGVAAAVRRFNERTRARVADSGLRIRHCGYLSAQIARKGERNLTLIRGQRAHRPDDLYLRMKEYEELEKLGRRQECDSLIAETWEILKSTPPAILAELPFAPMIAANYAQMILDAGDAETALSSADWALVHFGDEPWALHNRAVALLRLGRLDEAESALRANLNMVISTRAYYVEPGIATWLAWFHLAELHRARGQSDEATESLARCLDGNRTFLPARRLQVDLALERGELQSAMALLMDMVRENERDLWALVNGARLLAALSLRDRAESWARRALAIQHDLAEAIAVLDVLGIQKNKGRNGQWTER